MITTEQQKVERVFRLVYGVCFTVLCNVVERRNPTQWRENPPPLKL